MRVAPGQQDVLFEVNFITSGGAAADPDSVTVDITDATGDVLVNDAPAVEVEDGLWNFTYDMPADADLGLWRIDWRATFGTQVVPGEEIFEVADPDVIVVPSEQVLISRLRSRLGEIPYDVMDDNTILDLISYSGGDIAIATLEGWIRKMARYARLIPVSESGSQRDMDVKFKNAKQMVELWSAVVGEVSDATASALQRVVGRVVNLRDKPDPISALTPFSGYADHIREYPTHRLIIPAILS